MPILEIKSRFDESKVLYSGEALTMAELLENAVKDNASLDGANLVRANLDGAILDGANLDGANLYLANLYGAKIRDAITISKQPISIATTTYRVIIFDSHMRIGCKFFSLEDWWKFDSRTIVEMDGKRALEFWKAWKPALKAVCVAEGRK